MKTNKILAVALAAGLVLGGAYVADNNVAFAAEDQQNTKEALTKKLGDAKAELNKAETELAQANDDLKAIWAEASNAGSDDDTSHLEKDYEAKGKEVKDLKEKVEKAKAKVQELEKEIAKKEKEEKEEKEEKKDKKTTTIDDYLIKKNSEDGYISREQAEIAAKAYLEKHPEFNSFRVMKGLKNNYYFVPEINEKEEKKCGSKVNFPLFTDHEYKGDKKVEEKDKPEVKPAAPSYDYEYPLITPGKADEEIKLPKLEESKEVETEKEAKEKETTEVKEKSKAKENKKKEVKEVKKQAPARQAGRKNPKTGLESVAPVLSTLAISMAGIVATRKKNN